MMRTFLQRPIVIFAILLCCFQSWVNAAVDCQRYPYHQSCRGSMSKKRAMFPMRTVDCDDDDDCRLSRTKFLVALLEGNLDKDYDNYPTSYDVRHKKRKDKYDRRAAMENLMFELNMADDY